MPKNSREKVRRALRIVINSFYFRYDFDSVRKDSEEFANVQMQVLELSTNLPLAHYSINPLCLKNG